MIPDFPSTKIQFFDKNKNKIAEISLSKQNRKQEYFTFFYQNGQKMFHESQQYPHTIWDKTGKIITPNDRKKQQQFHDDFKQIHKHMHNSLTEVFKYVSYNK